MKSFLSILFSITLFFTSFSQENNCIDDPDDILASYDGYQCNDIVGSWFSWGCDDDLSVAVPGAPSGMWTIGDLCPQSCDECDEENIINCIDDPDGILFSIDGYQCNDIVGPWFSWGCDDDLSVAVPGAPSGMWTIGDLCPQSCDECDEGNLIIGELFNKKTLLKKIDFLGREIKHNTEFQLHIYDDGSIEKKYILK